MMEESLAVNPLFCIAQGYMSAIQPGGVGTKKRLFSMVHIFHNANQTL